MGGDTFGVRDDHDEEQMSDTAVHSDAELGAAGRRGAAAELATMGAGEAARHEHDAPVTENHVVEEGPTKMIGAKSFTAS